MAGSYSPKKVLLIIGVIPISGYAEKSMIEITPDQDDFETLKGADGAVERSEIVGGTWSCKFTLLGSNPLNAELSALRKADKLTNKAAFPLLCKDLNGTSIHAAKVCWFKKAPAKKYESASSPIEWEIVMTQVEDFVGGNASASIY